MKLIEQWRKPWKFWSVQLSAISAALMGAWTFLPEDLRANLPYASHLASGLFVVVAISRLVSQEKSQ